MYDYLVMLRIDHLLNIENQELFNKVANNLIKNFGDFLSYESFLFEVRYEEGDQKLPITFIKIVKEEHPELYDKVRFYIRTLILSGNTKFRDLNSFFGEHTKVIQNILTRAFVESTPNNKYLTNVYGKLLYQNQYQVELVNKLVDRAYNGDREGLIGFAEKYCSKPVANFVKENT